MVINSSEFDAASTPSFHDNIYCVWGGVYCQQQRPELSNDSAASTLCFTVTTDIESTRKGKLLLIVDPTSWMVQGVCRQARTVQCMCGSIVPLPANLERNYMSYCQLMSWGVLW